MLSENIKSVRKSKGLSQQELAVKLNVVRQTVSNGNPGVSKVKDTIYPNPRLHDFNLVTEY